MCGERERAFKEYMDKVRKADFRPYLRKIKIRSILLKINSK